MQKQIHLRVIQYSRRVSGPGAVCPTEEGYGSSLETVAHWSIDIFLQAIYLCETVMKLTKYLSLTISLC